MRGVGKETIIQLLYGIVAIKGYMKSVKSESVVFVLKIYFLFGSEKKNSLIQYSRGLHNHMYSMGLLW